MKSFLKSKLPILVKLYKRVKPVYLKLLKLITYPFYYWKFDILTAYANYNKSIFFIQIGANDGHNDDPIFNFIKKDKWKGILVEPVPYLFDKLKMNYKEYHSNLFFENSAIAAQNGKLPFYRLKNIESSGVSKWYEGLGSFRKDVILKHKSAIPDFDDIFLEDYVNTISFDQLLKKYSVSKLNLIHIDTEGYDYEIIKLIPILKYKIDFIMFEHKHLSKSDYRNCKKMLIKYGYKVLKNSDFDTTAVKKDILETIRN
jgi:FkbM family methyltransferase